MKIIFMGTPDFAVPSLEMLLNEGHEISIVFTQPDKPKGRGKKMAMPEVKICALENNLKVIQPLKIREKEMVDIIKNQDPDLIVVVAFGQILTQEILEIPKYGCINVHGSLLPKYRGAAPINWAIIKGEEKTGITTMQMDVGLDTGDILLKDEVFIKEHETAGELYKRLSEVGANTLKRTIEHLLEKKLNPIKQNDQESNYASMMDKNLGQVNWDLNSKDVNNLIRGVNPWPGAYTFYEGQKMKIWKSRVIKEESKGISAKILKVDEEGILVSCNDYCVLIEEIQMPNKKRMHVKEYIKGNFIKKDILLGE